ncbi:hypothetical protein BDZ89DRAFT_1133723 [Hymenopellis radicata]|nr:hypothetical protein BDZ89DRAFT_1133723 [Hymenopellis radicata]
MSGVKQQLLAVFLFLLFTLVTMPKGEPPPPLLPSRPLFLPPSFPPLCSPLQHCGFVDSGPTLSLLPKPGAGAVLILFGLAPGRHLGRFFDPPDCPAGKTRSGLPFSADHVKSGPALRGPKRFDVMSVVDSVCKGQDASWMRRAVDGATSWMAQTLWGAHDELDDSPDIPDHDIGLRSGIEVKVERTSAPAGPSSSGTSSMQSSPAASGSSRSSPTASGSSRPSGSSHSKEPYNHHPKLPYHLRRSQQKSLNKKKSRSSSSQKEVVGKRVAEAKQGVIRLEDYQLEDAPVTQPGWIGRTLELMRILPTLEEVLAMPDMRLIKWDGIATRPILDASNRIIALLGGQPREQPGKQTGMSFRAALKMAKNTIIRIMDRLPFHSHRRGPCKERTMGASYGGGQTQPSILRQAPNEAPFLEEMLSCEGICRIAKWADFLFKTYQPQIHERCMQSLRKLAEVLPDVAHPFPGGFPDTFWADQGNLAWAWCAVTALGKFNPDKGGHLIFWDLGLVIRFPPARPSFSQRISLVHFTAGGLFRYVDNGCKTDKVFMETDYRKMSDEERGEWHKERAERWKDALKLMTVWDNNEQE